MLKMTAKMHERKANRRRKNVSGISLIEVLVAIAILTIGMLAILLLFPAGLIAIGTAANSTNADRLGAAELDKANASQVQLIAAIYSNDDSTANINPSTLLQNANYEITSTGGYVANQSINHALSNGTDVDAFRSIKGETIRIPSTNAAGLSLYTVIAGPIESDTPSTLQVNGTPWQGISGDSFSAATDYLDPGSIAPGQPEYLIDYTNGEICLSAEAPGATAYPQTIVFTVTDSSGVTRTQSVIVPAEQCGQWELLSSLETVSGTPTLAAEGTLPWAAGTDTLLRNFAQVGTPGYGYGTTGAANFTSDPFQYQVYLPDYVATSNSAPSANLGVIAFNPLASSLHGNNGQPLEAVLNYKTYDWHIISEDRLISSTNGTARLSLVNILSTSSTNKLSDNTTTFTGLFTYSGDTNPKDPDFIVLDMDTGSVLVAGTDYTVNYPDGSVSFINSNGTYANDHLRIFYHPSGDWAVALARAPIVYGLDPTPANMTPALSSYSDSGTIIYFPQVDIGKQVDIRYSYVSGASTVTSEALYTVASISGNAAGVDLSSPTYDTRLPSGVTTVTPISVKGVSLSAIVIWNANSIWHTRTIATVLSTHSQPSPTNLQ